MVSCVAGGMARARTHKGFLRVQRAGGGRQSSVPKHWDDDQELGAGVAPLDDAERKWIARFARLMAEMPARLSLLEHGNCLSVIDGPRSKGVDIHDGRAHRAGLVLADVSSAACKVQSCSA